MDGSAPRVDDGEDEDEEELTPELQLRTDRSGGFGEKAFCSEGGRENKREESVYFCSLFLPRGQVAARRQAHPEEGSTGRPDPTARARR